MNISGDGDEKQVSFISLFCVVIAVCNSFSPFVFVC